MRREQCTTSAAGEKFYTRLLVVIGCLDQINKKYSIKMYFKNFIFDSKPIRGNHMDTVVDF